MKFEVIEHASDIGLRFFGSDFDTLVRNALEGTAYLIGDRPLDAKLETRTVTLRFNNMSDFLIQLLSQVIYYFDTDLVVLDHIQNIPDNFPGNIETRISGYQVNSGFIYRYILKSPTYYDFVLSLSEGYGEIIFDI